MAAATADFAAGDAKTQADFSRYFLEDDSGGKTVESHNYLYICVFVFVGTIYSVLAWLYFDRDQLLADKVTHYIVLHVFVMSIYSDFAKGRRLTGRDCCAYEALFFGCLFTASKLPPCCTLRLRFAFCVLHFAFALCLR